ncbi:CBS domain-containing protein [Streptomyces sp. KMM 9044]|uniref:CBS domain-containing protein n=1 Tax=Streptomyces sp. KMM 9044 TaxID=2744474 RepID=UPI00215099C6|nr:CBS domain-containing protein [Streptomyces sp. KMM 9044]WAX79498.1 CBS domain-containing protein [Streptomyces sp. KMM 9044]
MTLVQTRSRSPHTSSVHRTAADAVDAAGPQVWDGMTVEVALSVMAAARTGHLLVRDEDGRCTGLVTRARLIAVRDSTGYTDRVRLRDVADGGGPVTSPPTTAAGAGHAVPRRLPGARPVADEHGNVPGALGRSR